MPPRRPVVRTPEKKQYHLKAIDWALERVRATWDRGLDQVLDLHDLWDLLVRDRPKTTDEIPAWARRAIRAWAAVLWRYSLRPALPAMVAMSAAIGFGTPEGRALLRAVGRRLAELAPYLVTMRGKLLAVATLVTVGVGLAELKKRAPLWYGSLEMASAVLALWITLGKGANYTSADAAKLASGVYFIVRGYTNFREGVDRRKRARSEAAAAAPDGPTVAPSGAAPAPG